jgi:hypothetical protein
VESSTRGGGFCLCRRGFNRRVNGGNHRVESSTRGGGFCLCRRGFNRRVDGGEITWWNLQPTHHPGFVCVDAVSTAGWMGAKSPGGIFNPRTIRVLCVYTRFQPPGGWGKPLSPGLGFLGNCRLWILRSTQTCLRGALYLGRRG